MPHYNAATPLKTPMLPSTLRALLLLLCFSLLWPQTLARAADNTLPELGDSVSGVVNAEQEYKLGRAWLRKLRAATPMISDPLIQDYVEKLTYRLASHSSLNQPQFAITLVNDTNINAFAVPGGVVGVNAGLIIHAETEAEMASVMAHELGHLSQRHFARRLADSRRNQWLYLGALLTSIAVAAAGDGEAGMALGTSAQAALIQNELSYSRLNEQEADRIGMQTLVDAGLDPHAMPSFFSRLQRQSRQVANAPEFLSTHPVTQSRIADTMNRARQYPQRLAQDALDYQLMRVRVMVAFAEATGSSPAYFRRALEAQEVNSDRARVLQLGLALAQIRARQYEEAEASLQPLLAADPQRVDYLIAQADLDFAQGRYRDAAKHLQQPLRLSPDNYALQLYYSRALTQSGQSEQALPILETLTRQRPDDPQAWQQLIDAYTHTRNALGIYRARAELLFLMGDETRALEQLKLALKQANDNYPLQAKLQQRSREIQDSKNDLKF